MIINSEIEETHILSAIEQTINMSRRSDPKFGEGNTAQKFIQIIDSDTFWQTKIQKTFVDRH